MNRAKRKISCAFKFNPVGHGLFYTGQIGDFTFVYDCGGGQKKSRNKEIHKLPRQRLDLLIISHMHTDHVSGIPELLKHCGGVKEVVIPYLNPEEILLIAAEYLTLNKRHSVTDEFLRLLENPEEFFRSFGYETTITRIDNKEDRESINEERFGPEFIWSRPQGSDARGHDDVFRNKLWQFKFFCEPISKVQLQAFKAELTNAQISPSSLHYSIANQTEVLKDAYAKAVGKDFLNRTSLVCLHRPLCSIEYCTSWCHCDAEPCGGTLLTGDANFKKCMGLFLSHYSKTELESVCWTLVPHHGSRHNWHDRLFDVLTNCWMWICCSKHTNSHHPHKQILRTFFKHQEILYACTEKSIGFNYWLVV